MMHALVPSVGRTPEGSRLLPRIRKTCTNIALSSVDIELMSRVRIPISNLSNLVTHLL